MGGQSRPLVQFQITEFTPGLHPQSITPKGATEWPPQKKKIASSPVFAEIIEEVTGIEPSEVTLEKSFVDDLDIDSLSMVEIAVQTEDKYGVKIPDEDLAGLRTVGDVVNYIEKLEQENPEAAANIRAQLEGSDK
ncbi:acyl carrier protein [Mycobacteroides abscessus subsp. abscessus]|nr:acyl carrier protein [Mycobacteroides abscessus subsp. abscessus]